MSVRRHSHHLHADWLFRCVYTWMKAWSGFFRWKRYTLATLMLDAMTHKKVVLVWTRPNATECHWGATPPQSADLITHPRQLLCFMFYWLVSSPEGVWSPPTCYVVSDQFSRETLWPSWTSCWTRIIVIFFFSSNCKKNIPSRPLWSNHEAAISLDWSCDV